MDQQKENISTDNLELAWKGSPEDPGLEDVGDLDTVENVFQVFNERTPKGFEGDFRLMSIGDVVSLDGRSYQCRTQGWEKVGMGLDE